MSKAGRLLRGHKADKAAVLSESKVSPGSMLLHLTLSGAHLQQLQLQGRTWFTLQGKEHHWHMDTLQASFDQ
jgi:hypothetical protein